MNKQLLEKTKEIQHMLTDIHLHLLVARNAKTLFFERVSFLGKGAFEVVEAINGAKQINCVGCLSQLQTDMLETFIVSYFTGPGMTKAEAEDWKVKHPDLC